MTRSTATVGDLLEAWFDHAREDLSPKTVRETRGYLDRRNLIPGLGVSASTGSGSMTSTATTGGCVPTVVVPVARWPQRRFVGSTGSCAEP